MDEASEVVHDHPEIAERVITDLPSDEVTAIVTAHDASSRYYHKSNYLCVATDASLILNTWLAGRTQQPVADAAISTAGLCGCTVVILASSHATILAHVWERRISDIWWTDPNGQSVLDREFINEARLLVGGRLHGVQHLFPARDTIAYIIAPYTQESYIRHHHLGYPTGHFYQDQINGLKELMLELVPGLSPDSVMEPSYWPRVHDDDHFQMDPYDTVIARVYPIPNSQNAELHILVQGMRKHIQILKKHPPT